MNLNCSLLGGSRIHQEMIPFLEAVPGFRTRGVMELQVFNWSVFCRRVWENDRSVDHSFRVFFSKALRAYRLSLLLVNPELIKLGENVTRLMQALYPTHTQMSFLE